MKLGRFKAWFYWYSKGDTLKDFTLYLFGCKIYNNKSDVSILLYLFGIGLTLEYSKK